MTWEGVLSVSGIRIRTVVVSRLMATATRVPFAPLLLYRTIQVVSGWSIERIPLQQRVAVGEDWLRRRLSIPRNFLVFRVLQVCRKHKSCHSMATP